MMRKIVSSKGCSRKARAKQALRVQVTAESVALSMGFILGPVRSLLLRYELVPSVLCINHH